MNGRLILAILAAALAGAVPPAIRAAAPQAEEESAELDPAALTFFDGSDWLPLGMHGVSLEGAGATAAGTATMNLKANLGGPRTYAVLAGPTSEVVLSVPRPRFRIASDKSGALRVQLAQFEVKGENRRTTIERGKGATVYTKGTSLDVTRVAEGLWELKPTKSLQPGEYGLAVEGTEAIADFTIVERGY
ncbi:MAG TPA: hypothetical protein VGK76_09395 [Candidatus Eisenbacteria bacterium]|jgi:hypothetical protein